jgi:predicted small lipoprotein YifL
MRFPNLLCVLVLFLTACGTILFVAGCGTPGALYLPDGQTEQVQRVSIEQETFQPETEQQQLQNETNQPEEDEEK